MSQHKRQSSRKNKKANKTSTTAPGTVAVTPCTRRRLATFTGMVLVALIAAMAMGHWLTTRPSTPAESTPAAKTTRPAAPQQTDMGTYAANRPLADLPIGRTDTPLLSWHLVARFPHDPAAFTQGLLYHEGELYESTGLNGQSTLRRVELKTGRILQKRDLSSTYFGEGLALVGENLIQLTWQSGVGFVYDRVTFNKLRRFLYEGDGWGLTNDKTHLFMSDGTDTLRLLDPQTLEQTGSLPVHDADFPITDLNELEYVDGRILANIWRSDYVARIRPDDGRVDGWLNLGRLKELVEETNPTHNHDVLNGIAWDAEGRRLFVTGKLWPLLFEIEITESAGVHRNFGE